MNGYGARDLRYGTAQNIEQGGSQSNGTVPNIYSYVYSTCMYVPNESAVIRIELVSSTTISVTHKDRLWERFHKCRHKVLKQKKMFVRTHNIPPTPRQCMQ